MIYILYCTMQSTMNWTIGERLKLIDVKFQTDLLMEFFVLVDEFFFGVKN